MGFYDALVIFAHGFYRLLRTLCATWAQEKQLPCLDVVVTPDSAGHAEAFRHLARIH